LGIEGYLTPQAQRMVTLAGIEDSFARAEILLKELARWHVDDETIRRCTHRQARKAQQQREDLLGSPQRFAQADGDLELQIDAGKVNTETGWRDVKIAVFARRERGEPSCAALWDQRELPRPGVRSTIAAIEEAQLFGPRARREAERLGLDDHEPMCVLGDGAEWIWNLADEHFRGADQVLDVYHALEYLNDGAKKALGENCEELPRHLEEGTQQLLGDGYCGVVEWMGGLSVPPQGGDGAALGPMLNYLAGHQDRLNYALRLRRGQSIGSGLIEGSVKQLLTRRIKQTGARWKTTNVAPFVELCAMAHQEEWNEFWNLN
jgi:hypothetical protein